MRRGILISIVAMSFLTGGVSFAEQPGDSEKNIKEVRVLRVLEALKGSSILLEHSASIGHSADLSPSVSRSATRSLMFDVSVQTSQRLRLNFGLGMVQELTSTDTTYDHELLLDDMRVDLSYALPFPAASPVSGSLGVGLDAPTSKASQSASLILALRPSFSLSVTAPLLDGLSLTYSLGPTPRLHRYTTTSTRVPYPCSPAAGCNEGITTDQGARNTAFQLANDFSVGLSLLDERLSITASFGLLHSKRYAKSPSPNWSEDTLANPANGSGDPVELTSTFVFDASLQLHPAFGLSLGLWTPGGMAPDGSYYNPLGNRHSQVYFDLVFYPVDAWLLRRKSSGSTTKRD